MGTVRITEGWPLAIQEFRSILEDKNETYWGASLHDRRVPMIDCWDVERRACRVIGFYGRSREYAIVSVLGLVQAQYRNGVFTCGVVAAVCGQSGQWEELDFTPTDVDEALCAAATERREQAHQATVADLKRLGEWRLGAFERLVKSLTDGEDGAP